MHQIVMKKVTKTYSLDGLEIHALNDVSLEIQSGEFISISGHSGSGKTTLLSIIGGIAQPTDGTILFRGTDISSFNRHALSGYRNSKIGFMFQFSSLLPVLTSKENLLLPTVFNTGNGTRHIAEIEERAIELLKIVGLKDKINAYPSQLSGGQQRRVAIARAFMNDPEIILADEPTGDLDEDTEAAMMEFFMMMHKKNNLTFLIATHNSELASMAGRQIRMTNGSIL